MGYITIIFLQFICIQFTKARLNIVVDTRYSPVFQTDVNLEAFANKLKDYVEASDQPYGYCVFSNPEYPISNQENCGVDSNVGYIFKAEFDEDFGAEYSFQFGADLGGGAALFLNGQYEIAYQQDLWWDYDWWGDGVFYLDVTLPAGTHDILMVGNDICCDRDFIVRFSRNGSPYREFNDKNLVCSQYYNCVDVICQSDQWIDESRCENCIFRCSTCYNTNECITCSHVTRDNPPYCYCKIGYFQYQFNEECLQCNPNCLTCSSEAYCDSCLDNQYVNSSGVCIDCEVTYGSLCGKCNDLSCLECKNNPLFLLPACDNPTNCLSNQYKTGLWCKNCPSYCKTCYDSKSCLTCNTGYMMVDNICKTCQQKFGGSCGICTETYCQGCSNNATYMYPDCARNYCYYYLTTDDNRCYECEAKCLTCDTIDPTICTSCVSGFYVSSNDCVACNPPCQRCSGPTSCITCIQNQYKASGGCIDCNNRFYMDTDGVCISCVDLYGNQCGKCNATECTHCNNNQSYKLPECTTFDCPEKKYPQANYCMDCLDQCKTCSDNLTCDSCQIQWYLDSNDSNCKQCLDPCHTCENTFDNCLTCKTVGRRPPSCIICDYYFYNYNSDCVSICPTGMYGNQENYTCENCDTSICKECQYFPNRCVECYDDKTLFQDTCVFCDSIPGMIIRPGSTLQNDCIAVCGDGIRVQNDGHECDDGNNINGDGCDENCKVESEFQCGGGDLTQPDICIDKRPIRYTIEYLTEDKYLNLMEQQPIKCRMEFKKTFLILPEYSLQGLLKVKIDDIQTTGFQIQVNEIIPNNFVDPDDSNIRVLQSNTLNQNPTYDIFIFPDMTLKNRIFYLDIFPREVFSDGKGNFLANDKRTVFGEIKEYYYYSDKTRQNLSYNNFFVTVFMIFVIIQTLIYLFYYKKYQSQFYNMVIVLDNIQLIYFYKFINIRLPLNMYSFYQQLEPVKTFFIPSIFSSKQELNSKIDRLNYLEESDSFLNNTSSIILFLVLIFLINIVIIVMSNPKLYKQNTNSKMYIAFYNIRYIKFQHGVWLDILQGFQGIFFFYCGIQFYNMEDLTNFIFASCFALIYLVFIIANMVNLIKNRQILYGKPTIFNVTEEEIRIAAEEEEKRKIEEEEARQLQLQIQKRDEDFAKQFEFEKEEEMDEEQKQEMERERLKQLRKNPKYTFIPFDEDQYTLEQIYKEKKLFKYRNLWQFTNEFNEKPLRPFYYLILTLRKIIVCIVLFVLQDNSLIQIITFGSLHLILIILIWLIRFFQCKKINIRMSIAELFSAAGLGIQYLMIQDNIEDEDIKIWYCWITIGCYLLVFLSHTCYLFIIDVIPFIIYLKNYKKKQRQVENLHDSAINSQNNNMFSYNVETINELTSPKSSQQTHLIDSSKKKKTFVLDEKEIKKREEIKKKHLQRYQNKYKAAFQEQQNNVNSSSDLNLENSQNPASRSGIRQGSLAAKRLTNTYQIEKLREINKSKKVSDEPARQTGKIKTIKF